MLLSAKVFLTKYVYYWVFRHILVIFSLLFVSLAFDFYFEFFIFLTLIFIIAYAAWGWFCNELNLIELYDSLVYITLASIFFSIIVITDDELIDYVSKNFVKGVGELVAKLILSFFFCSLLLATRHNNKKLLVQSQLYIIIAWVFYINLIIFINAVGYIYIYILLEMNGLLLSISLVLRMNSRFIIESSIKYLVLSSFSSGILMLGVAVLYSYSGTLSVSEYGYLLFKLQYSVFDLCLFIGVALVWLSFFYKLYIVPTQWLITDVYDGASYSVLVKVVLMQSFVIVHFFLKNYYNVLVFDSPLKDLIRLVVAPFSMVLGCIGAASEKKLKKIICYSSTSVNGLLLFTITFDNTALLLSFLEYWLVYMLMLLLFFVLILNVKKNNKVICRAPEFFFLWRINRGVSISILFILFSFTSLPPFVSIVVKIFFLKSYFFVDVYMVALLFFIFGLVSYYYIRLTKNVFYEVDNGLGCLSFKCLDYSNIFFFMSLSALYIGSFFKTNVISSLLRLSFYSIYCA
jgi:NADH:ubiquinone oxidoreductase subunit 2 (subunit N)